MKLYLFISDHDKLLIGDTPEGVMVPHDEVSAGETLEEAAERIIMDFFGMKRGVHYPSNAIACPSLRSEEHCGLFIILPKVSTSPSCISFGTDGKPLFSNPRYVPPDAAILISSWNQIVAYFNSITIGSYELPR